jgi:multidrug resistance efflux pump
MSMPAWNTVAELEAALQKAHAENAKLHRNIDLLLADLEAAEAQVREWKEKHNLLAEAINSYSTDECAPTCDKYGHADDCPGTNVARMLEAQQAQVRELKAENERLKE